ncbi:hypothetical protein LZ554_000185 [Drepanopeziza brunnea f. sp. 'monogermtubi']|nr:hypothetical protein LZ554_000185 [Drepanopeziza brunnea f. sp. 'monogermtubi']
MKLKAQFPEIASKPQKQNPNIGRIFPSFSKLPDELRLQIYKVIASTPRVLTVKNRRVNLFVPPILQVSSEARAAALKCYTFVPGSPSHLEHPVYINFTHDILFFPTESQLFDISSPVGKAHHDIQANIQNIMVGRIDRANLDGTLEETYPYHVRTWRRLQSFKNLKTVKIIKEDVQDSVSKVSAKYELARARRFVVGGSTTGRALGFEFSTQDTMAAMAVESFKVNDRRKESNFVLGASEALSILEIGVSKDVSPFFRGAGSTE